MKSLFFFSVNPFIQIFTHIPQVLWFSLLVAFSAGFMYAFLQRNTARPFLNLTQQTLSIKNKTILNHNTILLRLALPNSNYILGLPVGKHIKVYAPNVVGVVPGKWNNKMDPSFAEMSSTNSEMRGLVQRKYTPITGDECQGFTDLLVKVYRRNESEGYPDGGKVSQYLDSLKVGDSVMISGPVGSYTYHGNGTFSFQSRVLPKKKRLFLIAGGTGITPFFQIIKAVLNNSRDTMALYLLFANKTEEDILLRSQLEEYNSRFPERFSLWYTIDQSPKNTKWNYSVGYINGKMIQDHFPPHDPDFLALLCGPPGMVHNAAKPSLLSLGWPESDILVF